MIDICSYNDFKKLKVERFKTQKKKHKNNNILFLSN